MRRLHVRISFRVRVRVYEVPDHLGRARLSADSKFAATTYSESNIFKYLLPNHIRRENFLKPKFLSSLQNVKLVRVVGM